MKVLDYAVLFVFILFQDRIIKLSTLNINEKRINFIKNTQTNVFLNIKLTKKCSVEMGKENM